MEYGSSLPLFLPEACLRPLGACTLAPLSCQYPGATLAASKLAYGIYKVVGDVKVFWGTLLPGDLGAGSRAPQAFIADP